MVERERIVFRPLNEVPLPVRLAALEQILATDPHMPKRERARLRALAHNPGSKGGRIVDEPR